MESAHEETDLFWSPRQPRRQFAKFWFEPLSWVLGIRFGWWRAASTFEVQVGPFGVTFNEWTSHAPRPLKAPSDGDSNG